MYLLHCQHCEPITLIIIIILAGAVQPWVRLSAGFHPKVTWWSQNSVISAVCIATPIMPASLRLCVFNQTDMHQLSSLEIFGLLRRHPGPHMVMQTGRIREKTPCFVMVATYRGAFYCTSYSGKPVLLHSLASQDSCDQQ